MVVRQIVPWFDESLRALKAKKRKLERRMLRSGLKSDKVRYRQVRNEYCVRLKEAKSNNYCHLISECSGDTKKLFVVVSSLINKKQDNPLPPHGDSYRLANDIGECFCKKFKP